MERNMSVVVATLPGGFTSAVFALARRHAVALLGVVAAHTSLRALWAGLKDRYRTPMIEAPGEAYPLAHDLQVVAKGTQGKAEWQLSRRRASSRRTRTPSALTWPAAGRCRPTGRCCRRWPRPTA
ncbi:MAG: hypothetical protein M5R40_07435 [Anaerolineae bacterium]|nr:hypothetical protein [Anaerolineae bacterium]